METQTEIEEKDLLKVYLALQRLYISQGNPEKALEIEKQLENIVAADSNDIVYYWHLTHLAYAFIMYDYDELAEALWKRIIALYQEAYNRIADFQNCSKFEARVRSIYLNSTNDLSNLYYNQRKWELHKELRSRVSSDCFLLTTSKYFNVKNVTVNVRFEEGTEIATCLYIEYLLYVILFIV